MREDMIFSGFGGQGIMFMGKILSYAATDNGKFVTWMPSYGAEVRGGTAHSMVVISDSPVPSPVVKEPTICVAMNTPSYSKFSGKVKESGILIINSSLVESGEKREDIDIVEIPATDIASGLGNVRIANMILLGALLSRREIFPVEILVKSLEKVVSKKRRNIISKNEEAIRKGYEYR